MKVDRIYISGWKQDLRWTQCCVASIRRWYPALPITLIKDTHRGDYDTGELESYWQVDLFASEVASFGWGMAKLEPLLLATGERVLVIDSDVLFLGPVLDELEAYDEDFIVDNHAQPEENLQRYYFDRERLQALDPDFVVPDHVFNSGTVLATTGLLTRADFEPLIDFTPPPRLLHDSVFYCGEQGVLNYVVLKKALLGQLSLRGLELQWWAGAMRPRALSVRRLDARSPYRCFLHYAGPKQTLFSANRNGHLLRHFEAAYYARLPQGRIRRQRQRLRRLVDVLAKRQPWTQYI